MYVVFYAECSIVCLYSCQVICHFRRCISYIISEDLASHKARLNQLFFWNCLFPNFKYGSFYHTCRFYVCFCLSLSSDFFIRLIDLWIFKAVYYCCLYFHTLNYFVVFITPFSGLLLSTSTTIDKLIHFLKLKHSRDLFCNALLLR